MTARVRERTIATAAAALSVFGAPAQVSAHPHIFVDARAQISFDREGRAQSLHNVWTFDEGYSAFAIQGLDADLDGKVTRAELQSLADENLTGLAEYGYYSSAGIGGRSVPLINGRNAALDYADGRVTLSFDVDFAAPLPLTDILELGISDPQYYVAIQFANSDMVKLVDAPAACGVELKRPRPMSDDVAAQLYALPAEVTTLPTKLQNALRGVQGGILVDCGHLDPERRIAEASTAVEAIDALARAGETPVTLVSERSPVADDPIAGWRLPVLGCLALGIVAAVSAGIRTRAAPGRDKHNVR